MSDLCLKNEKKGSTTVEAAIVFPLVILTMITCMLICMFFYSQTIEQSRLHIILRQNAGEISGHTEYAESISEEKVTLSIERKGLFRVVTGKEKMTMDRYGLLEDRTNQTIRSLWTASDGVSYVRYCTLARNVAEDITGR